MKRRIHAYCVGTGRSGTTSMAGIFSSYYRTAHDTHRKELFTIITALLKGVISKQDFRKYALYLDNKLQLEFNSTFLNKWLLDVFVSEFPDAKFIFTIRDCYSWLNSFIFGNGESLVNPRLSREEERFINVIFERKTHRPAKEKWRLFNNGFYTLDDLLSYWAKMNNDILAAVPKSRILVVKTREINGTRDEIADFLNIPPKTLDFTKSHMHQSMKHPNMLSEIDKDSLSSKVNFHCKVLMDKFFPGFVYAFE
jgi:hypothetical protein